MTISSDLTRRQIEIAKLLVEGKITKEVAQMLGVSIKTAETHRANIYRKLDIHNMAQLVIKMINMGFLSVDPDTIGREEASQIALKTEIALQQYKLHFTRSEVLNLLAAQRDAISTCLRGGK